MLGAVSSEGLGLRVSQGAGSVRALMGWRSKDSWDDVSRGSWGHWSSHEKRMAKAQPDTYAIILK